MSEPHTCGVNASEPHTLARVTVNERNSSVSEPHTCGVNVSEPPREHQVVPAQP